MKTRSSYELLLDALESLQANKPDDRSELDRRYAIMITDLEKLLAYYQYYVEQV